MYMYNVVMYDGVNSWVSYFVLRKKTCKKDIERYLAEYDAKAVYLDELYEVSLENILSFKDIDKELVFKRFDDMYIKSLG